MRGSFALPDVVHSVWEGLDGFLTDFSPGELERLMGIEPTLFAWEARVLPLNDSRSNYGRNCKPRSLYREVGLVVHNCLQPDCECL